MGKTQKRDVARDALVLALTLGQYLDRTGVQFTVTAERPGRQGAFSRTWSNASGVLSTSQAEDLAAWCQRTMMDALVAWDGVQEVLET